jgi:hypothetical protein
MLKRIHNNDWRQVMKSKKLSFTVAIILGVAASGVLAKGRPVDPGPPLTETTNNLSFPAIAADGYSLALVSESLTVPYSGPYTGLSAEQIAALGDYDWYAQKIEGNTWQAGLETAVSGTPVPVTYIDWGDNIESVNPKVNRPFRLEVTLYQTLTSPMTGYTMAVLANPSSPDEVQGTNFATYLSEYATVASQAWAFVVQRCGDTIGDAGTWNGVLWDGCSTPATVASGLELNVAGKTVFGGSQGGWKPTQAGRYRITFHNDSTTQVSLTGALVRNYVIGEFVEPTEGVAFPVVVDNISYVDVQVLAGGGGSGGGRR